MSRPPERFENPYFSNRRKTHTRGGRMRYWLIDRDGWAYIGSALLLVGSALYIMISRHWLWIEQVSVVGNQYITTEQIVEPMHEVLNDRRWLVIPQRFYLAANPDQLTEQIRNRLQDTFALENVVVTKQFDDTVIVTVEERVPGLVYINQEQFYYLDEFGVVTEQRTNSAELDPHFPRIRDRNSNHTVQVGEQIVQQSVIDAIVQLNKHFTERTGLDISEYALREVTCQEKQFVAEQIFEDEIADSESDEVRDQKSDILNRLQSDEITVDQSLDLLEEVKRSELEDQGEDVSGNQSYIQLEPEYVQTDCNYLAVINDVTIVTQAGAKTGPEVYFNSNEDITTQLDNLAAVLEHSIEDLNALRYIDARFIDRVYYK